MRRFVLIPMLFLCACGRDRVTVTGTLAEGTAASWIWAVGSDQGAEVDSGAFRLKGVRGDTLELRFAAGDDTARMQLLGVPPGSEIRLEQVWTDGGVAFPTRIAGAENQRVRVNGMWMGGSVPEQLNQVATVLAVSDDGDALLVRPAEGELPDLRVVVTPGTVVESQDGDPYDLDEAEFGDSLRISGGGQGDYVIATRLVVQRRVRSSRDREARPEAAPSPLRSREPRLLGVPAAEARAAQERALREQVERERKRFEKQRDKEKNKERDKGRGRGKGRDG